MCDSRSPGGGEARRQLPSSRSLDDRLRSVGVLGLRGGGRAALSSAAEAARGLLVSLLLNSEDDS